MINDREDMGGLFIPTLNGILRDNHRHNTIGLYGLWNQHKAKWQVSLEGVTSVLLSRDTQASFCMFVASNDGTVQTCGLVPEKRIPELVLFFSGHGIMAAIER